MLSKTFMISPNRPIYDKVNEIVIGKNESQLMKIPECKYDTTVLI